MQGNEKIGPDSVTEVLRLCIYKTPFPRLSLSAPSQSEGNKAVFLLPEPDLMKPSQLPSRCQWPRWVGRRQEKKVRVGERNRREERDRSGGGEEEKALVLCTDY